MSSHLTRGGRCPTGCEAARSSLRSSRGGRGKTRVALAGAGERETRSREAMGQALSPRGRSSISAKKKRRARAGARAAGRRRKPGTVPVSEGGCRASHWLALIAYEKGGGAASWRRVGGWSGEPVRRAVPAPSSGGLRVGRRTGSRLGIGIPGTEPARNRLRSRYRRGGFPGGRPCRPGQNHCPGSISPSSINCRDDQ